MNFGLFKSKFSDDKPFNYPVKPQCRFSMSSNVIFRKQKGTTT